MHIRHLAAASLALAAAMPAAAAITYTGSFSVAGDAVDKSGIDPAFGGNRLSFGSDLVFDRKTNLYYGITDRGPGGGLIDFAPRVNVFRLKTSSSNAIQSFGLVDAIVFTKPDGTPFSGLNPLLRSGNPANLGDSFDPEGVARLKNGNFLVSDEYGPSVYEFDPAGKQLRAFTIPENLKPKIAGGDLDYVNGRPTIVTGRQDNRGFEGLTVSTDGKKAYAVLQDPLVDEGDNEGVPDGRRGRNVRIVEFDIATGESTAQYIYQLESLADINLRVPEDTFGANAQGRNIGVSSITALPDGSFLLIERDNRGLGVDDPIGENPIGSKRVYRITLDGATDVSGTSLALQNELPADVVPVSKSLYLDVQAALALAGEDPLEKIEGLSFGRDLLGGLSLFLVTDNDFSVTQTGDGVQFDVCTSGAGGITSQVALGAGCPDGQSLIPSRIYGFAVTGADAAGLAVPEPATWALMVAGFGLVGGALRRGKRTTIAA